jgi:hypothetical protein
MVNAKEPWELSASVVDLVNPEWKSMVDTILVEINAGLGLSGGRKSRAELHKLSLCDEEHFLSHQGFVMRSTSPEPNMLTYCSENVSGILGTLAITLPSFHEGGEVKFSHGSQTKTFKTSQCSSYGCSFMARLVQSLSLHSIY